MLKICDEIFEIKLLIHFSLGFKEKLLMFQKFSISLKKRG